MMDSTNNVLNAPNGQNGVQNPDVNEAETQQSEETQATQAMDESQPQSQEEKEVHLFGSLHPCNPAQSRLDLWRTKPKITIGRRADNDIVLAGGKVSNIHAEIVWDGKTDTSSCVMIRDMNSTNGTYINGHKLERGTYRIMKQGNEVSFGSRSSDSDGDDYRYMFYHLAAGSPKTGLYAFYDLGPELGRGSFAIVYRAISKTTGQWFAVKIIQESRRTGRDDASNTNNINLQREIAIMGQLKHPNICELKDVFICDNNEINLVIELVDGGDLLEYIINGGITTEMDAMHITYQLCDALAYIHDRGVAHRDLKPENVLLTNTTPPQVKVADFGLAKVSDSMTMLKTMCGTPAYLAPEVVRQEHEEGYDNLVDSWSVGVILFSMITSASPFIEDETQKDIRIRISGRRIDWQILANSTIPVGPACRDFIERLLADSPRKRMTMKSALEHPWFLQYRQNHAQAGASPNQASSSSVPADASMLSVVDYAQGSTNNDERFSQGFQHLKIDSKGASTDLVNVPPVGPEGPSTPPSQRIPGLGQSRAEGSRMIQRRRDVLEQARENEVVVPEPSLEMITNFSAQEQKKKAKARAMDGDVNHVEKGPGKRVHAELSEVPEENSMEDENPAINGKASGSNKKGREAMEEDLSPATSNTKRGKVPKPKSNAGEETPALRRSNRNAQKAPRTSS
ncbi:hypothetical protein E1B28_000231 [Marasmius oreades]|uniref:Pkinase-domain-containing protein n=1 Tax=Marasmius oreades TaxID=181124 RepID=A0A9P7V0Z0_9AGAR|nr:uncharacterized protein E1B28_000231 [Marasmius oreades]KAG7098269.1 hypothetical protein E1B28_000231 [Marasmius oreades]